MNYWDLLPKDISSLVLQFKDYQERKDELFAELRKLTKSLFGYFETSSPNYRMDDFRYYLSVNNGWMIIEELDDPEPHTCDIFCECNCYRLTELVSSDTLIYKRRVYRKDCWLTWSLLVFIDEFGRIIG